MSRRITSEPDGPNQLVRHINRSLQVFICNDFLCILTMGTDVDRSFTVSDEDLTDSSGFFFFNKISKLNKVISTGVTN